MSLLQAIAPVLAQAGTPLTSREITGRILDARLWTTSGKTPAQTVTARIVVDIQRPRHMTKS